MNKIVEEIARKAKNASLKIAQMDDQTRNLILSDISAAIEASLSQIQSANSIDISGMEKNLGVETNAKVLLDRLRLDEAKGKKLAEYPVGITRFPDPLNKVISLTELDEGLELEKITCPLGLLCVVYESRPEVTIQVTSLAIKSGNGVILKGGHEALETNKVLFSLIKECLAKYDLSNLVYLCQTREEITEFFTMTEFIDLVIPRGSNEFVASVQKSTSIPVLGHSSGICQVYVDQFADLNKAMKICVDAKINYPAACNAVENILIHEEMGSFAVALVEELSKLGVKTHIDPKFKKSVNLPNQAKWLSDFPEIKEFSDLEVAIFSVSSVEKAVEFINLHGSHHTESIVTEDKKTAEFFLKFCDSASVFHNASTRFADGYVFGLGAEVGISTGKIHARGPVGLEGLITTKFILRGQGNIKGDYDSSSPNPRNFTHRNLPIT